MIVDTSALLAYFDSAEPRHAEVAQIDQPIGLTDACNIVLAEAYRTRTILTLDRRHFGVLRFADQTAPSILPAG